MAGRLGQGLGLLAALAVLCGGGPAAAQSGPSPEQQYQAAVSRCQGLVDQIAAAPGGANIWAGLVTPMRNSASYDTESLNYHIASFREDVTRYANNPALRLMYEAEICYMQTYLEMRRAFAASAPAPQLPARSPAQAAAPVPTARDDGLDPGISQAMAEADASGLDALRRIREALEVEAGADDGEAGPLGLRGQTPNMRPPPSGYNDPPRLVREYVSAPTCLQLTMDTPQVNSDHNWFTQMRVINGCGQEMLVRLDTWEELVPDRARSVRYSSAGGPFRFNDAPMYPNYTPFPPISRIGFRPVCYVEPGETSGGCAPGFRVWLQRGRTETLYLAPARPDESSIRIHYWLVACPYISAGGQANAMYFDDFELRNSQTFACVPVPPPGPGPRLELEGRPIQSTGRFDGGTPVPNTGRFADTPAQNTGPSETEPDSGAASPDDGEP